MGEGGHFFADATLASARWAGGVGWHCGGSSREPEVRGVSGRQPPSEGGSALNNNLNRSVINICNQPTVLNR